MRCEVAYSDPDLDGRAAEFSARIQSTTGKQIESLRIIDVYVVEGIPEVSASMLEGVFSDPVAQTLIEAAQPVHEREAPFDVAIEIAYRPGVTDPVAVTARRAIEDLIGADHPGDAGAEGHIQTARQFSLRAPDLDEKDISRVVAMLHNPLIQRAMVLRSKEWRQGARFPSTYSHEVTPSPTIVEVFDISSMNDDALEVLSRERLLALSPPEMAAIREYYRREHDARQSAGLPTEATDVELEMIAQTWSEHCKHKILNATITYREGKSEETIDSLFDTYVRGTTRALEDSCDYLRSVFHDDSGVIAFDEDTLACFKVETHNSPSALDPYGGAITGIVGVNRDILGTGKGARPIFNTNVLCFADPNTDPDSVPGSLLHPREVMRGVHRGIVDGGNQSGIPVVGGAFLFDESYLGKPLVFCGTGGIIPAEIAGEGGWIKHIEPGDHAVMIGGRIGKDGIHGATFSSLALDETSPTSAVQIGDPITQKLMSDFLIEARDRSLYKGITDNGAGGLSSSLGEMAETSGGIRIDLDACPLKYSGLAPWEILVSESQERMSLAVGDDTLEEFLELARRRDVEATVVGRFDDSGTITAYAGGDPVASISLEFLHHGLPHMHLEAVWTPPARRETPVESIEMSPTDALIAVLAEPNVASKEALVRQYDHEVQGGSVVKPFVGERSDAPSDGAVIRPKPGSNRGLTVTHGVCPRVGDVDAYDMAACAVDEAYRAHIALGGNPDLTSGLDNFCWSDPVASPDNPDGAYKLAQLVRACRGLADACIAYGIPLISGKDSMKNDARVGDRVISVRPTLLISLMGIIDDVRRSMTTDFQAAGDLIYLSGRTEGALAGSTLERIAGVALDTAPHVAFEQAARRYYALASCIEDALVESVHDCSDGGMAVAVAESAIGGRCGVEIDLDSMPCDLDESADIRLLFDESPSRFVISVSPSNRKAFESRMADTDTALIGTVTDSSAIRFTRGGTWCIDTELQPLIDAFGTGGATWLQ